MEMEIAAETGAVSADEEVETPRYLYVDLAACGKQRSAARPQHRQIPAEGTRKAQLPAPRHGGLPDRANNGSSPAAEVLTLTEYSSTRRNPCGRIAGFWAREKR